MVKFGSRKAKNCNKWLPIHVCSSTTRKQWHRTTNQKTVNMVALSLYRGNLHRVPDVPRRWLMPTRSISFKDFKLLLNRRSNALSRLHSSTSNPNPTSKLEDDKGANQFGEGTSKTAAVKNHETIDCGDSIVKAADASNSSPVEKLQVADKGNEDLQSVHPHAETSSKADDMLDDKEKRKKEVKEKLEVLNGKKHNLVQMLKQILNVEEELKRRNNSQGMTNRSPISPQVDMSNDYGSMIRHPTPRMGSEPNTGVDIEGRDNEDVSNNNNNNNSNNNNPRLIHQTSSTSPSSDSPLRKPPYIQHNMIKELSAFYPNLKMESREKEKMVTDLNFILCLVFLLLLDIYEVLHQSRPLSLGVTISSPSPSRFAPTTGHLGPPPPSTVPAVSVSGTGTNYIASSPSPAASGGTSSFRDVRQPSPWN